MNSIFKISKFNTYGLLVEGLEKDNSGYLNEETDILISVRNYSYSHTATINILTLVSSDAKEIIDKYNIVEHCNTCIDSSEFTLSKDGLYKISHIIIPNNLWLNYVLERDANALTSYKEVYYYDNISKKIYQYINGESIEKTIAELVDVDYSETVNVLPTNVIRSDKNTFILYYLNNCFNSICKDILSKLASPCFSKTDTFKKKVEDRDLIWMGINVIKYCIDTLNLYEAQRIYEELVRCGSPCYPGSTNITNTTNCGCNN